MSTASHPTPLQTKALDCPFCHQLMEERHVHGLTLDCCPVCRGLWFDCLEFDRYLREENHRPSKRFGAEKAAPKNQEPSRSCPRCQTRTLKPGWFNETNHFRCSSCGGLFLNPSQVAEILGYQPRSTASNGIGSELALTTVDLLLDGGLEIAGHALGAVIEFVGDVLS